MTPFFEQIVHLLESYVLTSIHLPKSETLNHGKEDVKTAVRFACCVALCMSTGILFAGEAGEKNYVLHNTIRYRPRELGKIQELINKSKNLNQLDDEGLAPLHIAAAKGETAIMEALLEAGADPFVVDRIGWIALTHAAASQNTPAIQVLLQSGVNINSQSEDGQTALHYAAKSGEAMVYSMLQYLDSGLDVDLQDECGMTALHYALRCNNFEGAQLLLDAGADQSLKDNHGKTPLDVAVELLCRLK